MYLFLELFSMFFDLCIIMMFLNKVLGSRKPEIHYLIYLGCFTAVELILYANTFIPYANVQVALVISTTLSIATTFSLCYLYNCQLRHKIFVALSFQTFALLGEYLFSFLVRQFRPELFNMELEPLSAIMNMGAKFALLLITCCFILFWNIKIKSYSLQYNLLLFTTPAISIILIMFIPVVEIVKISNITFYNVLLCCLTFLNIVNYMLLERIFKIAELKTKNLQMNQQIVFQKDKYGQLSAAYRNTRSIVHDTKKHYFTIKKFVENRDYDKLDGYIFSAIDNLESTYARINTGNLVIDSFVSNYITVADNDGIRLGTDISIDSNRIPVDDYDLCVILGNLLDNSLQACRKISGPTARYINISIHTDEFDKFIIHTSNSFIKSDTNSNSSSLQHGFGLNNIQKIVDKYHGMLQCQENENYEVYIIIPIIAADQRRYNA